MSRSLSVLGSLLLLAPLVPALQTPDEVAASARQLLDEGRTAEALARLEPAAEAAGGVVLLHSLGDAYVQLGSEWLASGGDARIAYEDARRILERALAVDSAHRAVLASAWTAAFQLGEFAAAGAYARRELGSALLEDGVAPPPALERAARADLRLLWQRDPVELEAFGAEVGRALDSLGHAVALAPGKPALRILHADLLAWVGLPSRASKTLAEGLRLAPEAGGLHRRLVDLHAVAGTIGELGALYRGMRPAGATATWYRAYAELLVGDRARREQRYEDADGAYRACGEWIARAEALEPGFAQSCRQVAFLASLGLGWSATRQRAFVRAASIHLELLGSDPSLHELRDGLGRTLIDAVGVLQLELVAALDFEAAVPLARRVAEVREDEAAWWNNLGFFLRERATQVECGSVAVDGDERAAARALFAESWEAYRRSAELAPGDARLVNDAALIQAYHLRTDVPLAREMLRSAIAAGERALAALGDELPEAERFPLAQAIGDAWENLGAIAYHVDGDIEAATALFERSLATNSGLRVPVRDYLAALRGERDPIPDPFEVPARHVAGPSRGAPARIPWEPSFDEGLARAAAEDRPLFVYYRGEGKSERTGILDGLLRRPDYVAPLAGAVCVLADANRSTPVDRRADGRRVPSHRHPRVTCAEHIAAARQFLDWWDRRRTADDLPLPEEGFYYLDPGGRRFVPEAVSVPGRADIAAALGELGDRIGTPLPGPDPQVLSRRLADRDAEVRAGAIEELFATPGRTRHEVLEAVLFDRAASDEARRDLVVALSRRTEEGTRSLLDALVRQAGDPSLQRLAIEACASSERTSALQHARAWSPVADNRRAATAALGRVGLPKEQARFLCAWLVAGDPAERAGAAVALGRIGGASALLARRLVQDPDPDVRRALEDALGGDQASRGSRKP